MHSHIAHSAASEVPPAAPVKRGISTIIRPPRCRSQPKVPVQSLGHGLCLPGPTDALRPDWTVRPYVRFANRTDCAVVDELVGQTQTLAGVSLLAHLRHHLHLTGNPRHLTGLEDCVRHRLLNVHVLAHLHRPYHGRRMRMVRRSYHNRIDVLFFLI